MSLGTYKVPAPLRDEDKWLKFFTKTQLVSMGIALAIAFWLVILFSKMGILIVGLVLAIIIVVVVGVCVMFTIPPERYLIGGGEKIDVILIRLLVKQTKGKKTLYIKNYEESNN